MSNLLNTQTVNYLELLGNGKLFRVPPYQRDYSWQTEQWEDLWNDLLDLEHQPNTSHYMGALVVTARSDRERQIIDGQQRLATLSILALAAVHPLGCLADEGHEPDQNRERARQLRTRFVGEKDPASLVESSKLTLNEADDPFYQDYLVQLRFPRNPRGLARSNQLLWRCFEFYRDRLAKQPDWSGDGSSLARFIADVAGRRLLFILITVDDEVNAYTVFETLNARGLELTTTDLLKNYLFSRVTVASDLAALQRRWRALMETVGPEHFPEFLRFHLQCQNAKVRTNRVFKLVRDQVTTAENVFRLMESLEARSELFAALGDPAHGYWVDRPDAKPYVRDLVLFRAKQMTPLLFAVWERFEPHAFVAVLRAVSVLTFRYTIISRLNPNELEPVYHAAARAVLDGTASTPQQVFDLLRPVYVDDTKFRQDFAVASSDTRGRGRRLAKYVLAALEADASGRHVDPDTDPATVEHILPENPTGAWEQTFDPRSWDAAVYRLGNLTLLTSPENREAGSQAYGAKLATYAASRYRLSRQVAEWAPEEWTPAILDDRQRRMADRAAHVWRVDFAGGNP